MSVSGVAAVVCTGVQPEACERAGALVAVNQEAFWALLKLAGVKLTCWPPTNVKMLRVSVAAWTCASSWSCADQLGVSEIAPVDRLMERDCTSPSHFTVR